MDEFSGINAFFNMIYHHDRAFSRALLDYQSFNDYRQWLRDHHIEIRELDMIDEYSFSMIRPGMTIKDISMLTHTNLQEGLQRIRSFLKDKIFLFLIPGINKEIKDYSFTGVDYIFTISKPFKQEDLSFLDPFPGLLEALFYADEWPGGLVFNSQHASFYPLHSISQAKALQKRIDEKTMFNKESHSSFIYHLSDLHLGPKKKLKAVSNLLDSLDECDQYAQSSHQKQVFITGDLMNSPNTKNMYQANGFMTMIRKRYKADITFVLGNHDMIVKGLSIGGRQRTKVIAYLLGEKIKVIEKDKIVLVKIDSNAGGNLARGMITRRQLDQIDSELAGIENLEDYTIVVLLHHHVFKVSKSDFLKIQWREKSIFGSILDKSKALVDAEMFATWLTQRHIKYVLHGHKHVPYFMNKKGTYYISAGSATGGLKESESHYYSYNVLRYDYMDKKMKTCLIFYDDKKKAERQRVEVYLMEEDE